MADRGLFARPDAPHRVHDLLLVAALAAGDLGAAERERADSLVAGCDECRSLAADLKALEGVTASLATPPRPRDFRLTAADATRIRSEAPWRLNVALHRPRLNLVQPIGAGLTMLGLAGLLLATLPGVPGSDGSAGSAASGGAIDRGSQSVQAQPAASGPLLEAVPAESRRIGIDTYNATGGPPDAQPSPLDVRQTVRLTPVPSAAPAADTSSASPVDGGRAALALSSAGLIAAGTGLWVVARRRRARRA